MKTKNLLLISVFSLLFSFNVFCQRDTIKYRPYEISIAIKDSNSYPIGKQDSFIVTNNKNLDSIFKLYKAYKSDLMLSLDTTCNHGIYRLYRLFCNCNEYLLLDTIIKFNNSNMQNFFCYAGRITKPGLNINNISETNNYIFYPNPVNDLFNIQIPINKFCKIEIFNILGNMVFSEDNICKKFIYNFKDKKSGFYLVKISSSSQNIFFKVIKN